MTDKIEVASSKLMIRYRCIDGKDLFDWGVTGDIPIMSLVGVIHRIQTELHARDTFPNDDHSHQDQSLIIGWDADKKMFSWSVHNNIPTDALIGMLEIIKTTIVTGMTAQRIAAQQRMLLGPDGRPM